MTDLITHELVRSPDSVPGAVVAIPAVRGAEQSAGTWRVESGARVSGPKPLLAVIRRFTTDLAIDTGITLEVLDESADAVDIRIAIEATDLADIPLATGVRADGLDLAAADERYGVEVTPDGVRAWGVAPEAVHRGLTTLRQLITAAASNGSAEVPCVRIVDGPRFAWRGLSVDVGRTFHDVETICRVVDMCSLYKLNVLHLHLTDDAGWRFEVPSWPDLALIGGAGALGDRPGGHYSPADVATIVSYASERFVTVVPEVDLPGHTQAVFAAYPELGPRPTAVAEQAKSVGLAVGTLDLDRGPTREFVADVFAAVAAQFPTSAWIHIGGDEAFGMSDRAHAEFVDFSIAAVRSLGRRAIGWQEAARAQVGPDEIVQYWVEPTQLTAMLEPDGAGAQLSLPPELMAIMAETLRKTYDDIPKALAKGASILVSPNSVLYLDRPYAETAADEGQEERRRRVGLPQYPPASLRDMVEWDVHAVMPGVDDDRIAGVEAAVWCETVVDREDLEFLLLPRLAGVGERAWSSAPTVWDEYALRLATASRTWDARGWAWFRSESVDWQAAV